MVLHFRHFFPNSEVGGSSQIRHGQAVFSCPSVLRYAELHQHIVCIGVNDQIFSRTLIPDTDISYLYIMQNLCQNSMKELWTGGDLVREHTPSHSNVFVSSKETHRMPIYYCLGYSFLVGEPSKHYVNMHIIYLSIYIYIYIYACSKQNLLHLHLDSSSA